MKISATLKIRFLVVWTTVASTDITATAQTPAPMPPFTTTADCDASTLCESGKYCAFSSGQEGICMDCDDGRPAYFSCALAGSAEDCINSCFPEFACSDANPCTDGSDQWCTYEVNNDSGMCTDCEGIDALGQCNQLSPAGAPACKSTCFASCSSNADCGDGSFCSLENEGSGYCADCSTLQASLGPQGCQNGTSFFTWTPAGEEACLSQCFDACTDSESCAYDYQSGKGFCAKIKGPNSDGYCASCWLAGSDPFDTDFGCFVNPNDPSAPAVSGEECASTCLGDCTLAGGCSDGYDSLCATGPEANGGVGYCMECSDISSIEQCFERNTSEEGKKHCAETCFGSCSVDLPCFSDQFCDFRNGEDGYCNECRDSSIYEATECMEFSGKGRESCVTSCFEFCSDALNQSCPLMHDSAEVFCDYQLNATAGACQRCPYDKKPELCVSGSEWVETTPFTEAGQESCKATCLRPCHESSVEADCGLDHYCSQGYCHLNHETDETPDIETSETSGEAQETSATSAVPFLLGLVGTLSMFSLSIY